MLIKKNKFFSFYDFSKEFKKKSNFFFICDHASNYIPKSFNNLGLSDRELNSHIAWDIGAKDLTLKISKKTKSKCFLSNFSRLIIDPNRQINDHDLIIEKSFGTIIHGNKSLNSKSKGIRLNFHRNYHYGLRYFLNTNVDKKTIIISIHSFTKNSKMNNRPNEIGLLWNNNVSFMLKVKNRLLLNKINVGVNQPYSGFFYNYTLDRHAKVKENKNLSIEIRNDLLCNEKDIKKWCDILIKSITTS